uniref:Cytochrome b-c1 complex subunit 10 n=1 Tax=Schistosoma mansoni TaxID=6183 RepID=A0A146MGE6_SCHMA
MDSILRNLKYSRDALTPLISLAKTWRRPAAAWTVTAGVLFVYFTDWKVICTRIPLYNRKFLDSDE